jgi:hypothetical protein
MVNVLLYLPIVLTLSEERDGGGVVAALVPTLSDDLQRDTSVQRK